MKFYFDKSESIFFGIGSNLNDPKKQILKAINYIKKEPNIEFVKSSKCYLSPPMGPQDQSHYFNLVIECKSKLNPLDLLNIVKSIESIMGRVENKRWHERIIDIDIIMYGQLEFRSSILTIPHPLAIEREFVMKPLYDINKDIYMPGYGFVKELIKKCKYKVKKSVNLVE